ncbi:Toll/interleukin-1 receptor domain-containing protein, partial [Tanacetum coccineum]
LLCRCIPPSLKLVDMIIGDSTTAHGVWKRLTDIFHDNKDARVIQLNNEIRNMAIRTLFVNDYLQEVKLKVDRLANLVSKVNDSRLVTYAINGLHAKFPQTERIIRHIEKLHTFDEMNSIIILKESDMLQHGNLSFHNTYSSPTILVAMNNQC